VIACLQSEAWVIIKAAGIEESPGQGQDQLTAKNR